MNIDTSLLLKLCSAFGPSGHEGGISELIASELRGLADEIYTDALGNLVARRKGAGKRVMLAAHMDSVGLIVTNITEDGFLYCAPVGGVSPFYALSGYVRFESGVRGVIMCGTKTKRAELKLSDMFIDVGARDEKEAAALVNVGDACIIEHEGFIQNGRVFSNFLDDRIGCFVLIEAFKRLKETENDVYFVFTVQEELGLRGARAVSYAIAPDLALSVDVMTAPDTPDSSGHGLVIGGGVGIKVKDGSVITHREVRMKLTDIARECGIKHQLEVAPSGGTDAGAIHVSRAGVKTGGLSVPSRYTHSAGECIDLADAEAAISLLSEFAARQ
ncbi:MAG: M20/M25/M40 family metallo-hydrolase [Clostridia bacterium]|nr:M20/M25/M40 family metallo-hydrolase [Clostridia bacterium]